MQFQIPCATSLLVETNKRLPIKLCLVRVETNGASSSVLVAVPPAPGLAFSLFSFLFFLRSGARQPICSRCSLSFFTSLFVRLLVSCPCRALGTHLIILTVAQSSPSILCVAGQCLQGYSSTTSTFCSNISCLFTSLIFPKVGAKLTASGEPMTIQLLPGQYTTTTNPQLLHNYLTSSATLVGSPGFQSGPLPSLPLSLRLQPGLAIYPQSLYSGQPSYGQLPSSPLNTSTPLPGNSIAISSNVWVAVSSNNQRIILWDSIPDISHLPYTGSLSLLDIQSTTCSPPCSGSGVCSASGNCTCSTGFNGTSCELCADNFFGPTCQPCPQGCSNCDQGISGSGRCLSPIAEVLPSSCNCLNGICGSNGQCTCNIGWTTSTNGTACAECAPGFFLTQSGDCQGIFLFSLLLPN